MSKQMSWILIVIALLVGLYVGYYYEKTKMVGFINVQRADMQQQIDSLKSAANQQLAPSPTVMPKSNGFGY